MDTTITFVPDTGEIMTFDRKSKQLRLPCSLNVHSVTESFGVQSYMVRTAAGAKKMSYMPEAELLTQTVRNPRLSAFNKTAAGAEKMVHMPAHRLLSYVIGNPDLLALKNVASSLTLGLNNPFCYQLAYIYMGVNKLPFAKNSADIVSRFINNNLLYGSELHDRFPELSAAIEPVFREFWRQLKYTKQNFGLFKELGNKIAKAIDGDNGFALTFMQGGGVMMKNLVRFLVEEAGKELSGQNVLVVMRQQQK